MSSFCSFNFQNKETKWNDKPPNPFNFFIYPRFNLVSHPPAPQILVRQVPWTFCDIFRCTFSILFLRIFNVAYLKNVHWRLWYRDSFLSVVCNHKNGWMPSAISKLKSNKYYKMLNVYIRIKNNLNAELYSVYDLHCNIHNNNSMSKNWVLWNILLLSLW